jgi:hypothetical protein
LLKNLYSYLFIDDLIKLSAYPVPAIREPWNKRLMSDLARLTLFSYILFVLNPVMPIVADKMAHTFWEEYHLVVVHGIYGNNHVHSEMDKAAKQADKGKSQKSGSEEYAHILFITTYNFSPSYTINRSYATYTCNFPVSYPNTHYPPPKVS